MIRIRTKMAPRWSQQITNSMSPLTVLSPYISLNPTLKLLADKRATIYTRFDIRDFTSGASKLDAFELLLRKRCKVYVVPDLHAKVIMDEDAFVTLGSQNLTLGGRSNKELSVCFDGSARDKTCKAVRNLVREWTADPDLAQVDWDWFNRMVEDVELAKEAYEQFNERLRTIVDEATRANAERLKAQELRIERERRSRRTAALAELQETVKSAHPSGIHHLGTVTPTKASPCLRFEPGVDLLRWKMRSRILPPLDKGSRCLCVFNHKHIGWARLAGRQITKIAQSMKIGGILPAPFKSVQIELSVKPEDLRAMSSDTTMVVRLSAPSGVKLLSVALSYSIKRTEVLGTHLPRVKTKNKKLKPIAQLRSDLHAWIDSDHTAFETLLAKHITSTTPLKQRLAGVNADEFFGGLYSKVSVTMMFTSRKNQPILVAKTVTSG
ncbi:hypothetical protein ALQ79_200366 [Pseudomonas amygdali pv. lachrymans]|nr:hypothetical protein ALQ79_200366 [Pseudomonas amygdali pv. lachrymans]